MNTGASWPSPAMARVRVLEMQTKLHRWAQADGLRQFDDLFNLIYAPAFLVAAWSRVSGNTGARSGGVDGQTVRDIQQRRGAEAFLCDVRSSLKDWTFRPVMVRERMIPKGGGKLRRLGIPTVADRVVQAAAKLVLEPIFEADFEPCTVELAGQPVAERRNGLTNATVAAQLGSRYMAFAADLDDDGRADLLRQDVLDGVVVAESAANGSELWRVDAGDGLAPDHNGDGVADLLRRTAIDPAEEWSPIGLEALDAVTGEVLWQADLPDSGGVDLARDLDGDGVDEVLLVRGHDSSSLASARALDGRTGQLRWAWGDG